MKTIILKDQMTFPKARAEAKKLGLEFLDAHEFLTLSTPQASALVFSKGKNFGQNAPFWLKDGLLARGNGMGGGVFYVNRLVKEKINPMRCFNVVLKAK
jgi:hypothetical protein